MDKIICDFFKEEIEDWDGLILYETNYEDIVDKIKFFSKPALLILNKDYNGWEKYEKLWSLKYFQNNHKKIMNETDFNNWSEEAKYNIKLLNKLAETEQKMLGHGTLEGPGNYWYMSGYSSEDDFYLDHYKCLKVQWFQKKFNEWTTYYRFFQLLQRLIMKTEGPDHRYFIVSTKKEKEKELDAWFEKLLISKQKKGYEKLRKEVIEEINTIFKGQKTVEQVLFNIRSLLVIFLNKYELVEINLKLMEEYEEKERNKRKKGDFT